MFTDSSITQIPKSDFLLDPSIIFLNHGSFGATPVSVFKVYQEYQKELEKQPVEFLGRKASTLLHEAREAIGKYINSDPNDFVFVPNATQGINIIARSLNLQTGDEVLSTDHEYGAMDRTWKFLSLEKGFTYKNIEIPLPFEKFSFIDAFTKAISPKTKVLFLSHITSPTALIFPVKEICEIAREKGILTIVDGAHAPGQIDLDLNDLQVDFYTGNFHKWLCAPKGSAFLYARKEKQSLVQPLIISWGWQSDSPSTSQFIDYLEWTGTRDIASYLSVPAAIGYQKDHNWQDVQKTCHEMAIWINKELCLCLHQNPLSATSDNFGQMVAVPLLLTLPAEKVKSILYDQYKIEIPITPWKNLNLLRVSIQGYNSFPELEYLVSALKEIFQI